MERRARRTRDRRQRRVLWLAGAALAITAVVFLVTGSSHEKPRKPAAPRTQLLNPPGPIPGFLLIADRGNNRALLVDSKKRILWRYPTPGVRPPMPFRFDDDTFFGPRSDRIISNQEDQHTIQIISFPAGKLLWRYGHVNRAGSSPGYLHTPDDAYLLPNRLVTVADAYNCRVLFITPAHRIVRRYGNGICRHAPPAELGPVNGATPLPDGGTLVSEINGAWVDDFGPDGRVRWTVRAPVSYPSDPQLLSPGKFLIADYARPGHALIMNRHGRVYWRYGPARGPGMLDHPSLALPLGRGLIAINDDYRHRVVIVSIRTRRIVWQYGHTAVAGRKAGYLNTPDGLDLLRTADAQRDPAIRQLMEHAARARR
jgi:hypothetical protein